MPGTAAASGWRRSRSRGAAAIALGALRVRTGDPFGLFTSEMLIGHPTSVVVFPEVVELPHWRLPPSPIDGTTPHAPPLRGRHAARQHRPAVRARRRDQPHPLAVERAARRAARQGVRPRAGRRPVDRPGSRSRPSTPAIGTDASVETAVTIAASVAMRTLADNRAVAMTASARRMQIHQPDRGPRVEQKLLHLLANVQADGADSAGRGDQRHAAAAAARDDAVHHHRLHRPHVGARPLGAAAARRRALVILLDRSSYISVEPDEPVPRRAGRSAPRTVRVRRRASPGAARRRHRRGARRPGARARA